VGGECGLWEGGKVGWWDTGLFVGIYVVNEICGISCRDEGALVEDVLVLQMRHPVFFPSVGQNWIPVGVPRMVMGVCRAALTWQLRLATPLSNGSRMTFWCDTGMTDRTEEVEETA